MAAQTTIGEFEKAIAANAVPSAALSKPLQALWLDARGDWAGAHAEAQAAGGTDGAWVHAYLHRKEGDDANAGYWYARAGRRAPVGDLAQEWREIAAHLLTAAPRT